MASLVSKHALLLSDAVAAVARFPAKVELTFFWCEQVHLSYHYLHFCFHFSPNRSSSKVHESFYWAWTKLKCSVLLTVSRQSMSKIYHWGIKENFSGRALGSLETPWNMHSFSIFVALQISKTLPSWYTNLLYYSMGEHPIILKGNCCYAIVKK